MEKQEQIKAPEYTDQQIMDMLARIFGVGVSDHGWKLG